MYGFQSDEVKVSNLNLILLLFMEDILMIIFNCMDIQIILNLGTILLYTLSGNW